MFCLNAVGTASALIAGYYALAAPCAPWPVTLVVSLLHAAGIAVYGWLLGFDVIDENSRAKVQAPGPDLRWCGHCVCYVTAGPRTKHCHECKKCVTGFDHHCVYLQSCVGAPNYRPFFALLALVTTWTCGLIAVDAALLAAPSGSSYDSCDSRGSVARVVLLGAHALVALCCAVLVSGLFCLHVYLCATRQTTYELVVARRKRLREEKEARLEGAGAEHRRKPTTQPRLSSLGSVFNLGGLRTGASSGGSSPHLFRGARAAAARAAAAATHDARSSTADVVLQPRGGSAESSGVSGMGSLPGVTQTTKA